LAVLVTTSISAGPAHAMSSPQRTVAGTVNTLYNEVNYWAYAVVSSSGRGYRSPGVGYAYVSPATYSDGCRIEAPHMATYCGGNIYFNVPVNQSKIDRLGDYASGYWLAHEFGHHVAASLGISNSFKSIVGRELYADCVAGAFTRYAYARGVLTGSDYSEALWTLGDNPYPYEGSAANGYPLKANRQAWFAWGYTNYNLAACQQYTLNMV
jgi:predicted metalloprotease